MKRLIRPIQPSAIAVALLAANALLALATPATGRQKVVQSPRTEKLINVPGAAFTITTASYSRQGKSAVDRKLMP